MDQNQIIDRTGVTIGIVTLIFSFILFISQSQMFVGSLFAAVLSAGLAWLTYIVVRLLVLTFSK
jgi:hypothetical protein